MQGSTAKKQKPPLDKTRMCMYHLQGRCKYGSACTFAHTIFEIRHAPDPVRKTKLCPLLGTGICVDKDCNFAHNVEELRQRHPASDILSRSASPLLTPTLADYDYFSEKEPYDAYSQAFASLMKTLGSFDRNNGNTSTTTVNDEENGNENNYRNSGCFNVHPGDSSLIN